MATSRPDNWRSDLPRRPGRLPFPGRGASFDLGHGWVAKVFRSSRSQAVASLLDPVGRIVDVAVLCADRWEEP